jgi:hypothetical protein
MSGGAAASPARLRFSWCVTGSRHFLEESLALAERGGKLGTRLQELSFAWNTSSS